MAKIGDNDMEIILKGNQEKVSCLFFLLFWIRLRSPGSF